MKTLLLITTTFERKEDAERIAALVLERRLVACAQISPPITSIYRWHEGMVTATEMILSLKTLPKLYPRVEEVLLQEHPYETPEIVAQEITFVSDSYRQWVEREVA